MAGKKKGKKGKEVKDGDAQASGSQQQGSSGAQQTQRGPRAQQEQTSPQGQQAQRQPQGRQPAQPRHAQQPQSQQASPGVQPQGQQVRPGPQPQGQQGFQGRPQFHPQGQQIPPGFQPQGQQVPPGVQPQGQQGFQGRPQFHPQGQQIPPGFQPQGQQVPPGVQPQGQQGFQGRPQWSPRGQQPQHPSEQSQESTQGQQMHQTQRSKGRGRPQHPAQSQEVGQPQQAGMSPEQSTQPGQQARGQPSQRGRGKPQPQRGSPQQQPQVGQPQPMQPQQTRAPQPGPSRAPLTEGAVSQLSREMSTVQVRQPEGGQGDTQLIPRIESERPIIPGTRGRRIRIETNHLSLNLGKLTTAVHYDVNLVPDIPKKLLRPVMERFREMHYKNRYPAFDGRKNLYSSSLLPFNDFISGEVVIQEGEGREKKFKVEVKFANYVDLTPLRDLLSSIETPREAMQVVDIVLRCPPASNCVLAGRSFFTKPRGIIDLGDGMEMYSGFYQSVIRGWKPFLNVDVAHKAFPKNMNLIDALLELLGRRGELLPREELNRPLQRYQEDILNSFIKTLRVAYEIPNHPSTRRVYRVNGIGTPPRTTTFKTDTGASVTVERYFETTKNYRLRYPHLPTLWVGAQQRENKILLPLELCTIEPGQVLNRKMNETQTSTMIRYAATDTKTRKNKIMTSVTEANHNVHPAVREFGFSIGNEFEKLEARVLKPPTLGYANNRSVNPSRGVWRGDRFFAGVTINRWTIVCVDRRPAHPNDLSKFAEMIFRNAASSGMNITDQAEKPFDHIGGSQSIHDIKKYFQTKKEKKYDVIFVIVPASGPQYSYVKTAAEINVGCLTQCIKSRTLNRMNPQTAINILLKVNSKLNGTNHVLVTRPPVMNRPCMIMGADVTHPSPDARNIPSVAAVTASHDPKAFQYNICWRLQPPKVEIIEDLENIAMEQLKYFFDKTKCKPERIIFFRDGVSEGQFEQVRRAEIRAIRSACKRLQADGYEPSITFLVVQKRHHTRLFPMDPRDSEDKNMNVPAGTCVDTTITHPFMQDFYLVSHASIQGVAKPTKYCTLWDDNSLNNDDIEELTYYLCHMFTRCNRSVSYPAPTYYAHLAAARAKVYIENERLNMDNLQREFAKFQIQDVIRKGLPMFFV